MTVFVPVVPNDDLWINPDPEGAHARIAVVGLWTDARVTAKRWSYRPAVCGPLRTLAGIDLFLRDLLANPQIRVVVVDGKDLSPDQQVTAALKRLWTAAETGEALDDIEAAKSIVEGTDVDPDELLGALIVTFAQVRVVWKHEFDDDDPTPVDDKDRTGGRYVLSPPAPKADAPAPHGDPGERVAGDTLADVYPALLHRIMSFGREVPTQYGMTRELLNLVAVIRDPVASLDGLLPPPSSRPAFLTPLCAAASTVSDEQKARGLSPGNLGACGAEGTWTTETPAGVTCPFCRVGLTRSQVEAYSRQLDGTDPPEGREYSYGSRMGAYSTQHDLASLGSGDDKLVAANIRHRDQRGAISKLLTEKPDTRAAFMTPWRPDEDSGVESGRPCLVGWWWRVVDGTLHLTVTFRSHDMVDGWPVNLAGICLVHVREAEKRGLKAGPVTCLSMSAHIYDRSWKKAADVINAWKRPAVDWDARSVARVEATEGKIRVVFMTPDGSKITGVMEGPTVGSVRLQVERSGLVTNVSHALYLGEELAKAAQKLKGQE